MLGAQSECLPALGAWHGTRGVLMRSPDGSPTKSMNTSYLQPGHWDFHLLSSADIQEYASLIPLINLFFSYVRNKIYWTYHARHGAWQTPWSPLLSPHSPGSSLTLPSPPYSGHWLLPMVLIRCFSQFSHQSY